MSKKSDVRRYIEKNIREFKKDNLIYYGKLSSSFFGGLLYRLKNKKMLTLDNYFINRNPILQFNLFIYISLKTFDFMENVDNSLKLISFIVTPIGILIILPLTLLMLYLGIIYYYSLRFCLVLIKVYKDRRKAANRFLFRKLRHFNK